MRNTIKSIARDLGVSHMTVSRALSGSENVSPETRDKVLNRAREVGYVKSPLAQAMRGASSGVIGLLLPNLLNEFYSRIANEITRLCGQHGLDVTVSLTNDDARQEGRALARLAALQAAAVIVVPAPGQVSIDASSDWKMRRIELVRTSAKPEAEAALLIDDTSSMEAAAERLVSQGRRKIGYIGASEELSSGRARLAAFRNALEKAGAPQDASRWRQVDPSRAMGRNAFHDLWTREGRPDAIVCGGIEVGLGALEACLELQLQLPDDLAFVGYGDPDAFRWLGGGVTTIAFQPEVLATRALELLLRQGPMPSSAPVRSELRVRATA